MEKTEVFLREMITKQLNELLPRVVESVVRNNPLFVGQEFISLSEAIKRYGIAASTLRNYHRAGAITLRRCLSEKRSRLFVSVVELERQLRENPLPRNAA
ncbi:MAG: hypothetical protein ACK5V5_00340 [Cyclobacteriaceae bacterium]|jgi:ACT domain-containing protein|nr:hypothetical protein [Flammeovirgaceae bacterium]